MSQNHSKLRPPRHLTRVRLHAGGWLFVAFCHALGGLNAACVKLPRSAGARTEAVATTTGQRAPNDPPRVNINTATRAELEQLPGIGPGLAARIIEHRARYGPFRRAEHLIVVRGISEHRLAELRPFISVE